MPDVFLNLDKDGLTGGLQLSIGDETGGGYRIAGPKYCGQSKRIQRHKITEHDARRIREYLDQAFPSTEGVREAKS